MLLNNLIKNIDLTDIKGPVNININNIAYDSRKCCENTLFVCIEGYKQDGHMFIADAIKNGAAAIIVTKPVTGIESVTIITVRDSRRSLAIIAAEFYGNPSDSVYLVGITGTKGKTTTSFLYWQMMNDIGCKTGLIGTLGNFSGRIQVYTNRSTPTTPESLDLQAMLAGMHAHGVNDIVMEASSIGLKLKRTYGCKFNVGVYTNIARDHIAEHEHPDMEDYFKSKLLLFDSSENAVINRDDLRSDEVISYLNVPYLTVSLDGSDYISCIRRINNPNGMTLDFNTPWGIKHTETNLNGTFNIYNIMEAMAICGIHGADIDTALTKINKVFVPGRLEEVPVNKEYKVLIDYAHTPDSLRNVLTALKSQCTGRLICVFGCGGDRDHGKRPQMGKISCDIADISIITSDNPRTEVPAAIVGDIVEGAKLSSGCYTAIVDRKEAIAAALGMAEKGDIVILAGKGQETYQMYGDRTIPFDERIIVTEILEGKQ